MGLPQFWASGMCIVQSALMKYFLGKNTFGVFDFFCQGIFSTFSQLEKSFFCRKPFKENIFTCCSQKEREAKDTHKKTTLTSKDLPAVNLLFLSNNDFFYSCLCNFQKTTCAIRVVHVTGTGNGSFVNCINIGKLQCGSPRDRKWKWLLSQQDGAFVKPRVCTPEIPG